MSEGYNPYFGIPDIMEFEERYGFRSTFFFRPYYDDGSDVKCYSDVIKDLIRDGWEVGVHLNSVESAASVGHQKEVVDGVTGVNVLGCRVHFLKVSLEDYWKIKDAGFLYDSSLKYYKDRISREDMGYRVIFGVVVFPITIMDAYLFTYMRVSEEEVIKVVREALDTAKRFNRDIITILWHDCSIKMKGGRMYGKVLEYLASSDDIKVVKGIEAYEYVVKKLGVRGEWRS
ncbi:MAG: hypothetical protein J7L51_03155 [Desulfurococcales archaeon]|nr:hypothetical protein [Desulfurococcales archaeon]